MQDLVQEFFKRDLSEAEQEALSKLLQESPEAALKYERLLEQNYLALGLPQPTLPKGLHVLPGSNVLTGVLAKALIVGLVLAGAALWKFWPQAKPVNPAPEQQPVTRKTPARASSLPVKHEVQMPAPVQPQPAEPGQEGQELSVLVNAPQRSLVTVRILNARGKEVRALYSGFVAAGKWDFRWDGLLENGEPASAGSYLIDVQSGSTHLTKNIQIKLHPASP